MDTSPLKIAVIGSGVAGLTATHILQRKHKITLFEKDNRVGGHTNTEIIPSGPDKGTPVDTGFIVMNHRNYPLLTRLFQQLKVELRDSDMSFGYYDIPSGLQYSSQGLNKVFAQRINLFRPRFHKLVHDILRFHRTGQQDLTSGMSEDESLGSYLSASVSVRTLSTTI